MSRQEYKTNTSDAQKARHIDLRPARKRKRDKSSAQAQRCPYTVDMFTPGRCPYTVDMFG